jgi:signal transduction histidine kinase/DNA-binding response OmpR family regulator
MDIVRLINHRSQSIINYIQALMKPLLIKPLEIPRLLILAFLLLPYTLLGQNKADSLKEIIATQPDSTAKVLSYLNLHDELKNKDPNASVDILRQALSLSKSIEFKEGEVKALLAMGDQIYTESRFDSALTIFRQAEVLAQRMEDRSLLVEALCKQGNTLNDLSKPEASDSILNVALSMATAVPLDSSLVSLCYINLGNNAFTNNQFDKALELFQQTLAYNQGDKSREAKVKTSIALIHMSHGDFGTADDYLQAALEIAQEANELKLFANIYKYLGMVKRSVREYTEARTYSNLALEHYQSVNDLSNMAHVHTNLSNISKDLGEYEQAAIELEKCLELLNRINFPLGECYTLNNLGELRFKMNDYKKAEDYFLKALDRSAETGILLASTRASKFLSLVYDSLGDYQNAYLYHVKHKALDDSLQRQANSSQMNELEEKYQSEQKQKEIELLSAENQIASLELEKQESFRNYLIIAALLLLLLIAVVYNRYQLKAKANAKLTELDQIKTNFFTNISHEFRTPLTLILSPVQKLLKNGNNDETHKELSIIQRNALRLTELINQLLELSKLEAGKLHLEVRENNLKELLKISEASFESLAIVNEIRFETDVDEAPDLAYYDEDKVLKILNNLLSNAFKFTPKGGTITLKAETRNDLVYISVADTGPGVSKGEQELIFQRFQQSGTRKSNTAGTGVGLTLSKELALLHQGDIRLESVKGKGTTFTLYFPFRKDAYPATAVFDAASALPQEYKNVNLPFEQKPDDVQEHELIILVVEDNAELRHHVKSLLKDEFTVKQAANGREGIAMALQFVPDIIISDLMMPEVDGEELCDTIKSNDKTSHIPIILLTAKADRETKLSGLRTGADDFLTKPFDNEELLIRVNNLITQRKNLQEKFAQKISLSPSKIEGESPNDRFIRKALQTVDDHLSDSEFTVEQFQEEMAMSRMQLHRKLKALTGFSASEFIRDIRLQRAADLLGQNGINIAEVAYSCGFNSTSYFTQRFKEKYGTSPSKYLQKSS